MSTQLVLAVVGSALTVLGAAALALLNSAIGRRSGIDDVLRTRRLEVYPRLWALSGTFSRWPRQTVTRETVAEVHERLRGWYYTEGGLFLTERARDRYGDLQELVAAVLSRPAAPSDVLAPGRYTDLMATASALRTAMTDDLDTRRRRTRRQEREREQRHREQEAAAKERLAAAVADRAAFGPAGADGQTRS